MKEEGEEGSNEGGRKGKKTSGILHHLPIRTEEKDILICKIFSSQSLVHSLDCVYIFFSLELRNSMRSWSTQKEKSHMASSYSSVTSTSPTN